MSALANASDRGRTPGSGFSALRLRRIKESFDALRSRSATSRKAISEHRHKRRLRDREVSDRSRRGLDWTNFFMADVQIGFGSFLAFYLADLGWSKESVGLALMVGGLAGVLAQVPSGALADAVSWKRGLAALGIGAIGAAAMILALRPSMTMVFTAEVLHGIASAVFAPAIAAISLGLAGRHGMSSRVGRNFRFAAAGNALTAALMGVLGTYYSNAAIFVAAATLCIPALAAISLIRANEIDYIRARNSTKKDDGFSLHKVTDLRRNWKLLLFAGCVTLFHLANAPLLPLVSQNLAHGDASLSPLFMAGLLIVPQIVVALLAPWIGYWSELWGRKPLLLIGFAIEAVRALLFTVVSDPYIMLIVQVLDGVTGAAVTVLTILVITDLTIGSGRFNLAQGALGTVMSAASAIGTGMIGFIVQRAGDTVGFLCMAAIIILGTALLFAFLPETKPASYVD
jgi:MFS family permease